jgi:hypothetical protein
MNIINFLSCGQVGDLIHQLYIVKAICERDNAKANLYIADFPYGLCACGNFTFDLNKTYADTVALISSQTYINKYEILPHGFSEEYINLNLWRDRGVGNFKTWTDLLSEHFSFGILPEYKWLTVNKEFTLTKGKVVIHNSNKRHNNSFNWGQIINVIPDDVFFITTNQSEFDSFRIKHDKIKPLIISDVDEMASAINSSRLFIGNQSLPLAIASSLDSPRIAELHPNSAEFYMGEHKYSDNISWFLSNDIKHNSKHVNILL